VHLPADSVYPLIISSVDFIEAVFFDHTLCSRMVNSRVSYRNQFSALVPHRDNLGEDDLFSLFGSIDLP
jgi:hypothetical protein